MFIKRYKSLFCFLVLYVLVSNVYAQKQDTISIYEYIDFNRNHWKIKIYNQDSIVFLAANSKIDYSLWLNGKFNSSRDSSVQFICDTSNKGKEVIETDSNFSRVIKMIAGGEAIIKIGNYYIPYLRDSLSKIHSLPKAKYFSGTNEGNSIIEFKTNNTYIIEENSCKSRFVERGSWTLKDNIINLHPFKKQINIHSRITNDDQFFIFDDYLVSTTFTTSMEDTKLFVVKKFLFFKNYFTTFEEQLKK